MVNNLVSNHLISYEPFCITSVSKICLCKSIVVDIGSITITGIDLVKEQIMIAAGYPLSFKQKDIHFQGHAIECRINAEDPKTFIPSPGTISQFHSPGGLGVRIESCIYSGYKVPPYYDSLIAKLIVHGSDRDQCLLKLNQALKEIVIEPISTTIDLHRQILDTEVMQKGSYDIRWLETKLLTNN